MLFLHNINFYINIIKGLTQSLIYNVFPTYLNSYSNTGYSSFEPIVTPHLYLYIPALIYKITNDISFSINIFMLIINFFQFLFMYICINSITKKKLASLFSSLLYVSIYIITINTTTLMGLSEHIAITFLPLLIYSLNNIYYGDSKKTILLVFSLFSIAESSILIFILSIIFILIYIVFNIINSIFKLKIFSIIFCLIVTLLLALYTYVPLIDYYFSKQIDIINIIGNNSVIFATILFFILILIYIFISKLFILKNSHKIFNISLSIIISVITILSIFIYSSILLFTNRLLIKDLPYDENVYIPHVTEKYLDENEKIFNDIYNNDGYGYFHVFVDDYAQNYLQMNIKYNTSDSFDEYFLDAPYYYIKGMRASNQNDDELKTMMSEEGLLRVFFNKGSGILHISYKNPILYDIANIISIIALILYLIFLSIKEVKDYIGKTFLRKNITYPQLTTIEESQLIPQQEPQFTTIIEPQIEPISDSQYISSPNLDNIENIIDYESDISSDQSN